VTKAPFSANSTAELPADRTLRLGAERLQQAVAELPLRYAPFFGRLSQLWEISEERVRSELTRARDSSTWTPTFLPGLRIFNVDSAEPRAGAHARLLKFSPRAKFPHHEHIGRERVLVLEGAYTDGRVEVHPGDEQSMDAGGEHELRIIGDEQCVTAISERGIAFTSPWLSWANLLVR
jgi:quercetin dioxygenase-like cupin family protein